MKIDVEKLKEEITRNTATHSVFSGTHYLLGNINGYDLILNITRDKNDMMSTEGDIDHSKCIVTEK